jgi:hypothetical protein
MRSSCAVTIPNDSALDDLKTLRQRLREMRNKEAARDARKTS